ncbi:MAG: hypothetical protein ABSB22_23520 [Thermodesulfobacteriota bacterium]|jgi:hypothetical protein
MEQGREANDIRKKFDMAKIQGRQSTCPKCNSPLQGGQTQYLSNYWWWNENTKRYERDASDPNADEPFCKACRAEYLDSLYK